MIIRIIDPWDCPSHSLTKGMVVEIVDDQARAAINAGKAEVASKAELIEQRIGKVETATSKPAKKVSRAKRQVNDRAD